MGDRVLDEVVEMLAQGRGGLPDAELDLLRAAVTFESSLGVTIPEELLTSEHLGSDAAVRALARRLLGE